MKKFKSFLLLILLAPLAFVMGGCSLSSAKVVYVTNIQKTEIEGTQVTYTVSYSDGSTSLITVENGKDGKDGEDVTIEVLKEYFTENGINFDDFIQNYVETKYYPDTVKDASSKALQSAVSVWTNEGCGAGVIYKMEDQFSYIVTNYHVVYSKYTISNVSNEITVYQYGTQGVYYENNNYHYGEGSVDATYVGGSMEYDLAVLRVNTSDLKKYNETAQAVTVADDYDVAEAAIAVGNPNGENISVTEGIISVESEIVPIYSADDTQVLNFRVMRIDTAINSGNSGGGLFNDEGELIGIVNAKAVASDIDNIAYALPYDNVVKVVDNIIYYYKQNNRASQVKKVYLDITCTTKNSRSIYDATTGEISIVDDCTISAVSQTSTGLGHFMGLEAGDIIKSIKINSTEYTINRWFEFGDYLLNVRIGDTLTIIVERDGVSQTCYAIIQANHMVTID
ncbi:MAG: serine protease [Clostridiales bacterium]|nr:serine protease [Clostridiales bacterium]